MFKNTIVLLNQTLTDFRVVMLNVYDTSKHDIFHYVSEPDFPAVNKGNKLLEHVFSPVDDKEYNFIEFKDDLYLQIFSPLYHNQTLLGFMDLMVEVNPNILNRLKNIRTMALIITISTILTMTLVLYPLTYNFYQKLQGISRELRESHLHTILALGNAIAKRDSDTDEHNYRVTYYSLCLAEHVKMSPGAIRTLVKGAFLHDVGKIGIRDNILLKQDKLTDEEFKEMQTHVELGEQIVKDIRWLADAREVILFHHERYDGCGYPFGTAGEQIPLTARIFAVVDVFDALTSQRPYKQAFSYEDAIKILFKEAQRFDPKILNAFLKISEKLYNETAPAGKMELIKRLEVKLLHYFEN
nr:HD-GYP domain-containing protein [uncultured Desulfobacter sp.]